MSSLDRGDYRVERIIYESQPKFYVTANLYIPQKGKGPYPAVLQSLGHSVTAKSRDFYQSLAIGLVKLGYVVLNYDPLGQGERRIFWDQDLGDSKVGDTVNEHEMVGVSSLLIGNSIARDMLWDAIRGIDVLEQTSAVDPQRIGAAGCSGGGTITAYLAAFEPRLKAVADACYITSWEDQLEGTGPQDAEQEFPGMLEAGLDHADLVEQFAPKPYLVASTKEDFFPLAGARKAVEEARRIYGLFDAADRLGWYVGPGGHGIPRASREAIYDWMNRFLKGQPDAPHAEPEFVVEFDRDLNCTKTGQVATSLGGETASTLKIQRAREFLAHRKPDQDLREAVLRLTRFERPSRNSAVTTKGTSDRKEYSIERLAYEVFPGRSVPGALFAPHSKTGKKAILFVSSHGEQHEAAEGGDLDSLAKAGYPVLAIDPAGIGESAAPWPGYSETWFGNAKIAWLALMVGRPLMGIRMEDIVRGVDLLESRGFASQGVIGFGKGSAGVAMLHAAMIDERLHSISLEGTLASYALAAETPLQRQIHDLVLSDVLRHYDLPDLAAALGPSRVHLVNLKDAMWNALPLNAARTIYRNGATLSERREFDPLSRAYPEFQ